MTTRTATHRARGTKSRPARTSPYVFISYRRDQNSLHAALLESSLAEVLGPGAAFLDKASLEPGDAFPARIEHAIRDSAVVVVVIGRNWLEVKDPRSGRRRLDQANDFVRREIEWALELRRKIVPVLVDGAVWPPAERLPPSIASLTLAQAVDFSWLDGVRRIAETATTEAQRLNAEVRVAVGDPTPANAAVRAMEASIRNQNGGRVTLDESELAATLDRITDFKRDQGAFLMPDLIYAIDLIGVRARRSARRYVARSKALASLDDLVAALRRNQTVVAGLRALDTWWSDPALTKRPIEDDPAANFAGGFLCIVSGWHEARREFEVHTFHTLLGNQGVLTLTYKAAKRLLNVQEMRMIEAAPMPVPFSAKAQRDLESRLPKTSRSKGDERRARRRG
jgi:TIR domain-containing protein